MAILPRFAFHRLMVIQDIFSRCDRRAWLQGAAGGLAFALGPLRGIGQENPVEETGTDRQLFLDDLRIDSGMTEGVTLDLQEPERITRVLRPEKPSEALGFIFYCSVVDDGGVARLFHGAYDDEKGKHFALATSGDGLHWERPELGLRNYRGSTKNHLLPLDAVEASVFLDPVAPPEKRYRLLYSRHWPDPERAGVYLASSPDGIHWTESDIRLLPFVPDSQHCGFWDPERLRYVIYTRAWNPRRCVVRVEVEDIERPWPYDTSARPLHIWGDQKVPTLSRELPTVIGTDDRDPAGVEIYTNAAFRYSGAPGSYLAFPAAYQTFNGPDWEDRALNGNDGHFDVQFASSRDGMSWKRWRKPWVGAGWCEGLDLRLLSMGPGLVRRGREMHQYFVGWPHTHGRPVRWDRDLEDRAAWLDRDLGGIYCATTRQDGFVAAEARYPDGLLVTMPLRFRGNRLVLNFRAEGSGGAAVSLLDPGGDPIPGFGEEDAEWISCDEVNREVSWRNGSDLSELQGRPVRLQFRMRNARLFAFQFVEAGKGLAGSRIRSSLAERGASEILGG